MKTFLFLLAAAISFTSFAASAAVTKSGLSCRGHGAENQAGLKAFVMNRLIVQTYSGSHGAFAFDSASGTLTIRTRVLLSTICVASDSETICAPFGQAARVRYSARAPGTGLALVQPIAAELPQNEILLDCREI